MSSLPDELVDRGFFETSDGGIGFNANFFAEYILDNYAIIYTSSEKFYLYSNGVYLEKPLSELSAWLYDILQEPKFGLWTKWRENEYIEALKRLAYISSPLNPRKDLLNLQNGMFSLKKRKRFKHNPKYYSTIQLPIVYDKDAKCPQFRKFLKEVFLEDTELIRFVQEMIGYCISTDNQAQCFFILYGTGANGKSLLCNVIKKLVGKGNYSTLSISDLSKSFSRADLKDKTLNVSAENESPSGKPFNSQYVKAISGGDEIKAEFKGKDVFTLQPYCKLIFAVNTLPNFNDKTTGFIRRVKIIPFKAQFSIDDGTADINLEDKLLAELSGIFNWAVRGLLRLRKNNYCFTESKAVNDSLKDYIEIVNPYTIFWDECIRYRPEETKIKIFKSEVYNRFTHWAMTNNHQNLAKVTPKKFWSDFEALVKQKNLPELQFKKSGGKRFVLGLEIANENNLFPWHRQTTKEMELDDELSEDDLQSALLPKSSKDKKKTK